MPDLRSAHGERRVRNGSSTTNEHATGCCFHRDAPLAGAGVYRACRRRIAFLSPRNTEQRGYRFPVPRGCGNLQFLLKEIVRELRPAVAVRTEQIDLSLGHDQRIGRIADGTDRIKIVVARAAREKSYVELTLIDLLLFQERLFRTTCASSSFVLMRTATERPNVLTIPSSIRRIRP